VVVTFVAGSPDRPVGGAIAIYEFANGMRRRGHDVHLVHRPLAFNRVGSVEELEWFEFEEGIRHHFPRAFGVSSLPESEFIFHFSERLPDGVGLPLMFVQGTILGAERQRARMRAPCPKICIATWLVSLGREAGVPEDQLVYIPYGLKHDKYRLVFPIEDRPLRVSALYHRHPLKGAEYGIEVLKELKERLPRLEGVVFGTFSPVHEIPSWISFVKRPDQETLVNEIYNRCRVFLCASLVEGFGFTSIEAMACGAALVTTANGGSDDYAVHDETALVCAPQDVSAMADQAESLLQDGERRIRLARRGREYVRHKFDWDASAAKLERFLHAYAAEPDRYLRQPVSS
jgi:glycosyltransferase involved in cell wall biosynthesis